MTFTYKYLVPTVTISPPRGFTITDVYPVHHLADALATDAANVVIEWTIYRDGEILTSKTTELSFLDRNLVGIDDQDSIFRFEETDDDGWQRGDDVGYLETRVQIEGDGWFSRRHILQNYTVYSGHDKKSFISPQALKFSSPQIIEQIRSYKAWTEGYPAAHVDRGADIDLSVVLINPYDRATLVTLQFPSLDQENRFKVPARTARRISLASCIPDEVSFWRDQFYLSGPNRIPCFMVHHRLGSVCDIVKLEHLDPYRGETAWVPFSQALYDRLSLWREQR